MSSRLKILIAIAGLLGLALVADQYWQRNDEDLANETNAQTNNTTILPTNPEAEATLELLPAMAGFDAIWKQPLFAEGRVAVLATRTLPTSRLSSRQNPNASGQTPDLNVVGVAIRPDGGAVLIRQGREVLRVLLGDEIDGWRIDDLGPDSVTVSRDGESWQIPVGNKN